MNINREVAYLLGLAIGLLLMLIAKTSRDNAFFTWMRKRAQRLAGSAAEGKSLLLWGGLAIAAINLAFAIWFFLHN
jgi:hypothetical protein